MNDKEYKEAYTLQSVDNALRIITSLTDHEEMGISELSRELEVGKSTAFRLVATLRKRGFIVQNNSNEKYRLSLKFVQIGSAILKRYDLISMTHSSLVELTKEYNETTHLAIMDGFDLVFIDKVSSKVSSIQMHSAIGARMPLYCTGTGKLLLAHLSDNLLEKFFKNVNFQQFTSNTITNRDSLLKELERIRANGFSEDNEEKEIGLTCFAAPIINNLGEVIAALSISGVSSRMKEQRERLIDSIKRVAAESSLAIGWLE